MTKLALSAYLADKVGIENIAKSSKWGRLLYSSGVVRSADFRRIEALPRRVWENDPTLAEATRALEADLRLPGGEKPCGPSCRCPRSLWPNQAAALIEGATLHGLFAAPHGVGRGKALISILLPLVMGAERPVLFVPAQLRDQTRRKVLPMLAKHWRLHPRLRVVGYSELSVAKNRHLLDELAPDLIVLDECHNAKNAQAARTKRLREYLKENPLTRVAALSGTATRRSLRDYWQLVLWTLKPDLSPLPTSWRELSDWADALDEGIDEHARKDPGAIMSLCREGESARDGYRRRLVETPGVVATSAVDLGVSLRLSKTSFEPPARVQSALAKLRSTWTTPYGDEISEPVDLWRHARELALGFFYRWQPEPPRDWLDARREWKRLARETLRNNRRGLDSELLVARDLAERHKRGDTSAAVATWFAWHEIRSSFEINTVPEWIDDFAIERAARWLADESEGPGVVWVEHIAFGERLAQASGRPYFGAGMKASAEILDATGPIIASVAAHGEGKNLQAWSRALVVSPPSSGKTWEQLLGRQHREGQLADEVEIDVLLHAEEQEESMRQAMRDADYIEQTTGARQKLNFASRDF